MLTGDTFFKFVSDDGEKVAYETIQVPCAANSAAKHISDRLSEALKRVWLYEAERGGAPAQRIALSSIESSRNDDQIWRELVSNGHDNAVEGGNIISVACIPSLPRNIDSLADASSLANLPCSSCPWEEFPPTKSNYQRGQHGRKVPILAMIPHRRGDGLNKSIARCKSQEEQATPSSKLASFVL